MNLSARLKALEARIGNKGPCQNCGGRGHWAVVLSESPTDPVDPKGCPTCGKVAGIKRIILGEALPALRRDLE